jgi:predicted nucleic acid-binding protein
MTVYWDTSAIIHFVTTRRVQQIAGVTRTHTLAELFSSLTGRGWTELMPDGRTRLKKMGLAVAAKAVKDIRGRLELVELSADEVLAAISNADKLGAQGGRIHDLLHAVAANKAGADELWTLDQHDFDGLGPVPVKQL